MDNGLTNVLCKTQLVAVLSFFGAVGCVEGGRSFSGAGLSWTSRPASGSQKSAETTAAPTSGVDVTQQAGFEELSEVSMRDFLEQSIAKVSNDSVEAFGYSFDNLADFFAQHESEILSVSATFATLGDYFDYLQIASFEDVRQEDVDAGYQVLEALYRSGEVESLLEAGDKVKSGVDQLDSSNNASAGQKIDQGLSASVIISLALPSRFGVMELQEGGPGQPQQAAATGVVEYSKPEGHGQPSGGNDLIPCPYCGNIGGGHGDHGEAPPAG